MTYPFYYIFGNLPKFFKISGGMAKSCLVELVILKKSFSELRKIPLNDSSPIVSVCKVPELASVFPFKTIGTLLKSPYLRWLERVFNFENDERLQKIISDHVGKP